jgi:hypothetical protein
LGKLQRNRNLHTGTPGNQGCCHLATHGHTVQMRSLPLH